MVDDEPTALPADMDTLFADGGATRGLAVALPQGRLVWPAPDHGRKDTASAARPVYWLSDAPGTATLWSRLHTEHGRSGLWPLLLQGVQDDPQRPWATGEVAPAPVSQVDRHDAGEFLAQVWADWAEPQEGEEDLEYDFEELAPFGRDWPGLAAPGELMEDPTVVADWYAGLLDGGTARQCSQLSITHSLQRNLGGWHSRQLVSAPT